MQDALAIDGGTPVRETLLPYGKQSISQEDIDAVTEVLQSDWLTTGPTVGAFEEQFAQFVGTAEAVAVSNGTAALHALYHGLGVQEGDEVIVPAMTFAATANAAVYLGGTPVFADSDPDTLLISPQSVAERITPKTKAICAVDYGGQPADYAQLQAIADEHNIALVSDACHAIGGAYNGTPVGGITYGSTFSFHPVKSMTSGEGGMISTNDPELAQRMRTFRNHAITTDHRERQEKGSWFYEQVALGFNYRLTDFQCALGMSQLRNIPGWVERRQAIAAQYDAAFASMHAVTPLLAKDQRSHGYHLYVIQLDLEALSVDRGTVFQALRAENIGVNVHYIPVHYHPYYRETFGTKEGMCPQTEAAYERILTLPIFPGMSDADIQDVLNAVEKVTRAYL